MAQIALATRCLRWSSPIRFNDPFDVTQELRLSFDGNELHVALTERLAWLMEHDDAPVKHPAFELLVRTAKRLAPEARRPAVREMRERMAPRTVDVLEELKATWRTLVPTFRILCLSEVYDVTPMWSHYADEYKGVVLEFCAVEEVDSAFRAARRVIYQDTPPSIADVNEWVKCILHERERSYMHLFLECLYVKTTPWSYEREWRIVSPGRRPGDDELFGDYGFSTRELTGVYFGPRCPEDGRTVLLKLLTHDLGQVKAYQMEFDVPQARLVARRIGL